MLIDETYFTKRLNLPQRGNPADLVDLLDFIEQYEKEYLQCVLGLPLWQAFTDGTEGSGIPDARYQDLLTGKDFTYNNCTHNWNGFKPASKISPIANYVYCVYVDDKVDAVTLTGVTVSSTENNRTVASVDRIVWAWNRMVDMNRSLYYFLKANKTVYPEWKICYDGWPWPWECGCGCCDYCTATGCGRFFVKKNFAGL